MGYDDPVTAAKKVLEFSKKNEKLKIRGGVIEGRFFDDREVRAVADLPPREVLLSVFAGTLQAPLSKLAGTLAATVSRFGHAMNSLKTKKESGQ
jgi:large subunit ribosomal protein L10